MDAADIEITGLEHASVATASEPLSRRLAHAPAAWRALWTAIGLWPEWFRSGQNWP